MQFLFPSALTAVEVLLLTGDAQLSLFQRSFGNTKGRVGSLILLRLCAHVTTALGELGESFSGSTTRLSISTGFMMHIHALLTLSEVC